MAGKSKNHMYAGFTSGLVSAVALQPFDLLKTRVQQSNGKSMIQVLKSLNTPLELWRGTLPSALRMSVGSAMYFTCLNTVREAVAGGRRKSEGDSRSTSSLPKLTNTENLVSGGLVRGTVGFLVMPITVIKVRYESSTYHYKSIVDAATSIYKHNGMKGFFYGWAATFARDAPYAGLYMLFYEQLKVALPSLLFSDLKASSHSEKYYSSWSSAMINSVAAATSAGIATTCTNPFDTVKTRMQLMPKEYPNFLTSVKTIVQHEGVQALFRGLALRICRKACQAGISWCIYEDLVKRFERMNLPGPEL
ncbi:Solute carrier family 25 member 38-like protein [Yarrowia sp. C11]|nr:Solute carrier family 25 member 38-like protein [Yarrowia sp. E02]KAG5371931.1 Solute carrier family 25 member 38-like protein [Yarrowia sp. C11]